MILPAKPLIGAFILWFATAIIVSIHKEWLAILYVIGSLILLWMLIDFLCLKKLKEPQISRQVSSSLSLGIWGKVTLIFHNKTQRKLYLQVFDHYPDSCEQSGLPVTFSIKRNQQVSVIYRIKPKVRGEIYFAKVQIRLRSPFWAWLNQEKIGQTEKIRVYPNFSWLLGNVLQGRNVDLSGAIKHLQRAQGMDFKQLREYQEGDSQRQIDWKASTRLNKIISREYQDERDQRVLLMLDCGRRMASQDGDLSHFDYVLNAVLLMSYVSLRHGDSVGLITISAKNERFISPQRSSSTVNKLLNNIYDLQPSLQTSDFEQAAQNLISRERKRSLVILFTNLRDEDDQNLLDAALLLSRRHLVLIASLREEELDLAQNMGIFTAEDAALRAAAIAYNTQRMASFARLKSNGILCLDCQPKDLAIKTVNRYLKIKLDGRL